MLKRLSLLLLLLTCAWSATSASGPRDMGEAKRIVDNLPVRRLVGIWQFPDDLVTVLIRPHETHPYRYEMIVVENPDAYPLPGTVLATFQESPDANKFEMEWKDKGKAFGKRFSAQLTSDGAGIIVKSNGWKVKFNPMGFLPNFWRILRIYYDSDSDKTPTGLIKVYPNTGIKPRHPVML